MQIHVNKSQQSGRERENERVKEMAVKSAANWAEVEGRTSSSLQINAT